MVSGLGMSQPTNDLAILVIEKMVTIIVIKVEFQLKFTLLHRLEI